NWPDKSFDLTDKDKTFHVAKGLKVGDPVMVSERKINGKDTVEITEHSGGGVKHGAKTRDEELNKAQPRAAADRSDNTDRKAGVSYGRIKEITPAKVVVDVDNWPDKSFDLTDREKTLHLERSHRSRPYQDDGL